MDSTATLTLTKELIRRDSITPKDKGCQELITQYLEPLGFKAELMPFADVENLWIRHGTTQPVLVFAGHTDVVPTGSLDAWNTPPFEPVEKNGNLYGRGAADMKTSIAAMTQAAQEFVCQHPDHKGSIALLITSDEEGPSVNGTVKVCNALEKRGETLDYCVVGEPTSNEVLGDTIKNGRRGSLTGRLSILGKQGHVAYPHLAENPIHKAAAAIAELVAEHWDYGNEYFPPTTMQISNFHAGTGASNVVPGEANIVFNFRFSTASTPDSLISRVEAILDHHQLNYELDWDLGGEPFLTNPGELSQAACAAIEKFTGVTPKLSTSGGTSDGRFIAKICPQVIEFGPINASIHQVNEHIAIKDIEPLKNIYLQIMKNLLL